MKDAEKSREQLIAELKALRRSEAQLRRLFEEMNDGVPVGRAIEPPSTAQAPGECEEQEMWGIVEHSRDGITLVDEQGKIIEWNRGQEKITGLKRDQVLGRPLWEIQLHMLPPSKRKPTTAARLRDQTLWLLQGGRATAPDGFWEQEIQRADGTLRVVQHSVFPIDTKDGFMAGSISRDITDRVQAEQELRKRGLELALLNQASRAFVSTLDLDQVLVTVLEGVRHLLNATACLVWLIDPATDELVCSQVSGPQGEIVQGWRLSPDEGLAGWVAQHGTSSIVADVQADPRYSVGIEQQTGVVPRAVLSVPLRSAGGVVGVLQAASTKVGFFDTDDVALLEPLAATAAIAIENARLYEQTRQDAETKAVLLREVNHRVKNNLTAIMGLLYAARRYAEVKDQPIYQSIMNDLVNRVQGLATVHSMLSASQWQPLLLSELTIQVIHSVLRALPEDRRVSLEVSPSTVRVAPDQASNLALVINELATNAIKYALPERGRARISVRIGCQGALVRLEFRDDGPGYPEKVLLLANHSAGFALVQNIVRKNLGGELWLHNDHGAVAVIEFQARDKDGGNCE